MVSSWAKFAKGVDIDGCPQVPGKGNLILPWHKAGPLTHPGDTADPDHLVVNKEYSLSPLPGVASAVLRHEGYAGAAYPRLHPLPVTPPVRTEDRMSPPRDDVGAIP